MSKITENDARKVLKTMKGGLCSGLGRGGKGQMCVQHAVSYALEQHHGDSPDCVDEFVRQIGIDVNDMSGVFSSKQARMRVLKRFAIAQLGSAYKLNQRKFHKALDAFMLSVVFVDVARHALTEYEVHDEERRNVEAIIEMAEKRPTDGRTRNSISRRLHALDGGIGVYLRETFEHLDLSESELAIREALKALPVSQREAKLTDYMEGIVQALSCAGSPGCEYLGLTE